MADVVVVKKRVFTGLDANKASVTGSNGDRYLATDTAKIYFWANAQWKTDVASGAAYVPLNPPDYHWSQGSGLIENNVLQVDGLDLTGIVPVGTVGVSLGIICWDNQVGQVVQIWPHAGSFSYLRACTQVANLTMNCHGVVPLDADRLMDYQISIGTFDNYGITVIGYFI